MRLLITTPTDVVVDVDDVVAVRAEDESGSFGILAGHTDLLTALTVSVVAWRHRNGKEGFCAVRHGILSVEDGEAVSIATREAHVGTNLDHLEREVLKRLRAEIDTEKKARVDSLLLQAKAIREIMRYLRPEHMPLGGGP